MDIQLSRERTLYRIDDGEFGCALPFGFEGAHASQRSGDVLRNELQHFRILVRIRNIVFITLKSERTQHLPLAF